MCPAQLTWSHNALFADVKSRRLSRRPSAVSETLRRYIVRSHVLPDSPELIRYSDLKEAGLARWG
jgi:hypothetical protein